MKKTLGAFALALAGLANAGHAATVYDEAVSGDIPTFPMLDLGILSEGVWTFFASLDGGEEAGHQIGNDEQDSVMFTVLQPFSILSTTLSGVPVSSSVYIGATLNSAGSYIGSASNSSAGSTFTTPGTYAVLSVPQANRDFGSYRVDITVGPADPVGATPVPLPAAGLLLAGAVGALGSMRRRHGSRGPENREGGKS